MRQNKNLGTLLPEETDGKSCPECKSTNIKDVVKCEGCGIINKECLDCGVQWQEFIQRQELLEKPKK